MAYLHNQRFVYACPLLFINPAVKHRCQAVKLISKCWLLSGLLNLLLLAHDMSFKSTTHLIGITSSFNYGNSGSKSERTPNAKGCNITLGLAIIYYELTCSGNGEKAIVADNYGLISVIIIPMYFPANFLITGIAIYFLFTK